jgi:hypothetical protein
VRGRKYIAVTHRYHISRPVPCCCLLLSIVQCWEGRLSRHIILFITTCTDLFSSSGREGYICVRANNSIRWVNEWGVNYRQVGSGCVPVANRLSRIACCVLAERCSPWLRQGKAVYWLVMKRRECGAEMVAGQPRRTGRSLAARRARVDVVLKERPNKLNPSRLRTIHHLQLQHHRHSHSAACAHLCRTRLHSL